MEDREALKERGEDEWMCKGRDGTYYAREKIGRGI